MVLRRVRPSSTDTATRLFLLGVQGEHNLPADVHGGGESKALCLAKPVSSCVGNGKRWFGE